VVGFNFPVHVPAVPLQSDARGRALDFRESRCAIMALLPSLLDHNAPPGADRLPLAAGVDDDHWLAGCVIGSNRTPIAPLDRGLGGTGSTVSPMRSAVI
jgi:hypothetical protein